MEQAYAGMGFTRGTLSGAPVVVAQCSAGKVNAALCAQAMVDLFRPRLVLNIGVAGGVGPDVHIGDVVVATACVQYDFDTTALDPWPVGQLLLPGVEEPQRFLPCDQRVGDLLAQAGEKLYGRVHRGVVATGDRFVADPQFGLWLHKEFGALACEMEGAAIAQVCLVNQVPCGVLRAISDNALDSEDGGFRHLRRELGPKGPGASPASRRTHVRCVTAQDKPPSCLRARGRAGQFALWAARLRSGCASSTLAFAAGDPAGQAALLPAARRGCPTQTYGG